MNVHTLNHAMKGPTCWVITSDCALTDIKCHTFVGERNGVSNSGLIRENEKIDVKGGVPVLPLGCGAAPVLHLLYQL